MHADQKDVRGVSWDLAKGVLNQLNPDALRFEKTEVEQVAFPRGAYLGDDLDEELVSFATVLRAAARALTEVNGDHIRDASNPEDVAAMLGEHVKGRIPPKAEADPEAVGNALGTYFKQHPSIIDEIFGVFLAPNEEKQERDPTTILSQCVLKVTDREGRISTGFALCQRGHVLTAEHVVRELKRVNLAFRYCDNTGERRELPAQATIVFSDRKRDIAILEVQGWEGLQQAGLTPPPLSIQWQPRDWVLCLGYQEQQIFADPITVEAFIKPHDPRLSVRFRDDSEQECLTLVIPRDHPAVVPGMSGGPVLNQRSCHVVGMVTGATREAWVKQRWHADELWEKTSSAPYGFATPLSDVQEGWPSFKDCCLAGNHPKGGHT